MSDEMEGPDLEEALAVIYGLLTDRLLELGISAQLPSKGVIRIFHQLVMDYWNGLVDDDDREMASGFDELPDEIAIGAALEMMGRRHVFGIIGPDGETLYIEGHKVTVEARGKVISRHQDGSECRLICPSCEEPDVRLQDDGEDGGFYAFCASCGSETVSYPEKFRAVAAWIAGKTTTAHGR